MSLAQWLLAQHGGFVYLLIDLTLNLFVSEEESHPSENTSSPSTL